MTPIDLLELFKEYCNGDLKEFVELTNDFIRDVIETDYMDKLEKELNDICYESDVCCKCGSYLDNNIEYEKSEFLGQVVEEEINNLVCTNCM